MSALRSEEFFAFRRALREFPDGAGLAAVCYDWCAEHGVLLDQLLILFVHGRAWELHQLIAEVVERRFGQVPAQTIRGLLPPDCTSATPEEWGRVRAAVL